MISWTEMAASGLRVRGAKRKMIRRSGMSSGASPVVGKVPPFRAIRMRLYIILDCFQTPGLLKRSPSEALVSRGKRCAFSSRSVYSATSSSSNTTLKSHDSSESVGSMHSVTRPRKAPSLKSTRTCRPIRSCKASVSVSVRFWSKIGTGDAPGHSGPGHSPGGEGIGITRGCAARAMSMRAVCRCCRDCCDKS